MKVLSVKKALLYGVATAREHALFFIGAMFVLMMVNVLGIFAFLGINWPTIMVFVGRLPEVCGFMFNEVTPTGNEFNFCLSAVLDLFSAHWLLYSILFVVGCLVLCAVSCYIMLGWVQALLAIYDRHASSFSSLFVSWDLILPFVLAGWLYAAMVITGSLLLVVPGIILAIKFGMFVLVLVDKRTGGIEALRQSSAITQGAKGKLFLLGLVVVLLSFCVGVVNNLLIMLMGAGGMSMLTGVLLSVVTRLLSALLYVSASLAGVYAYRVLSAQTYAPTTR